MADPNLSDFYGRLRRVQKIRRRGGGFEAAGTLGRSSFNRRRKSGAPVLAPILIVFLAVIALKGMIYARVGAATYEQRVSELQAGQGIDRVGGFLMQADPLTLMVARQLRPMLP